MVPSLVDLESLDHFCATTSGEVSFHSDLQLTEVLPPQSPTLHRSHRDTRCGIMIPSPRCGDYRSFLTFQSPSPLFTEFSLMKSINFSDKFLMLMKTLKLSDFFEFDYRPLLLLNVIMSCDNDQFSTSRIDRSCVSDLPSSRMWHCVLQLLSPS
ncbi:Beta-galactosidase related protein [Arabidopsis thaliana]|uniref:Beta-galactosidase related protein n=1 Tax=Arabidopsis thaliana TaxID=3702 RepID=F4J7P5_ARATH|nr:Beta-galactosidase related protein [Arabidopsis thaliana]AEE76919.1 Beta-galactosidase related protein [Arabidopsis thaliana]|eukprot:NP_001189963.1 Beta-galactosidase related protein [Arabidopsis thaliana]